MWLPKQYTATEDTTISLQVCRVSKPIMYIYYIKDLGDQPTSSLIQEWVTCSLSRQTLQTLTKEIQAAGDIGRLAEYLYKEHEEAKKAKLKEEAKLRTNDHLSDLYAMFEE